MPFYFEIKLHEENAWLNLVTLKLLQLTFYMATALLTAFYLNWKGDFFDQLK